MTTPLLDVRDLHIHYDTQRGTMKAVEGISFTLERGSHLGLIGEEFKTARLHLTKKLAGSAAWKGERRDRRPAASAPASEEVGDARAAA